jgi:hypothetical protein
MNLLKIALVMIVFLVNLAIAQPSWADKPKVSKNSDYVSVTKTLNKLLQTQESETTPPELKQRIDELKLQKAAIESGITWGQCRNETGKTLAIYGPAEKSSQDTLYFLADGQTTPTGWDCNGIYLPNDGKFAGIDSTNSSVFKITDGTRLVATLNPDTSEIEFNVPLVKDSKAETASLPSVSQAFIDSRIPSDLAAVELDD